ncbi:restriction endonuclease subunit S [Maribacter flavus]|uniref:Type I restriction modification DNA specificity domain-containing protein n=1 Tax=Maribacter flavus TaxID=1658664 RepID=A0A5B2TT06_9FLAO|nr:restriction endonuclease subunit S [Maribacter flavus]KAA2217303.1 hypothetical protein F0361_15225 [Maribacter flavus]
MAEVQLTPLLRFPEFENNWETLTLEKMSSRIGDGIHGTPQYDEEGAYFFVNGNNLSNGRIEITETTKKVSEEEQQKHYRELNDRTILMSINGTIGNLAYYNNEPVMLGKSAAYINLLPDFEISYVFNYLSTRKIQAFFHSELTGSTIKNLSLRTIRETKLHLPTDTPEQQKIASFLTAVDARIQLLQKKKAKLEEYKKGVMQKLFSQEIRFKNENGNDFPDWEEKRLGEIGATFNGLTGKTKDDFGEGKPYVQYMQIFSNSKIIIEDFGLVKIDEGENQSKVQYGDVFFTTSSETPNEIGTASVMLDEIGDVFLNSFCFGFRPNSLSELVPYFSRYLFRSALFRREIIKLAQGSTRFNMSKVELMKLKVFLPREKEQIKIAEFLTSLDDSIESIENEIDASMEYKKGLLQKMFV